MLFFLEVLCGTVFADSVVFGPGIDLEVTQTLELTYSYEKPLSADSSSSLILEGGSVFCSDSYLEEFAPGLEAGVELRGYRDGDLAGFFVGGNASGELLWPSARERLERISFLVNFGWKHRLPVLGVPVAIEPNWGAGITMDNDNSAGWEYTPKPLVNFDLKLSLF
ncbi:MAG TPA: hypothetical protein PKX02_00940 [Candidatus Sabulitectum sp.]|nr:hypothetical protein [Candidatus Sabulitectum sp.]